MIGLLLREALDRLCVRLNMYLVQYFVNALILELAGRACILYRNMLQQFP